MNIENYNTLYTIFLVLTFVFIIIDIVLFFVFDIKKIISVKTGYAKKQSIKEMNQSKEDGTTVLQNSFDEDTVLLNQDEVTAVLSRSNDLQKYVLKAGEFFEVVYSEMVIPSKNII